MANPLLLSKVISSGGVNNMTGTAVILSGPRPLDLWQTPMGTFEVQITGAPNGTLTLEGSNSYDPISNPNATFVPLATGVISPSLPAVVGAPLSYLGSLVWGSDSSSCRWLRLRYVNASGTGTLDAWFNGKGGRGVGAIAAASFTPLALGSTLKLWLRGDLGVTQSGGNVTAIADQSGNGNNVTNVGTIPFVASSINGQAGWTHSAGTTRLTNTTSSLFAGGSPRTIFVVSKAATEAGGPLLESRLSFVTSSYYQGGTGYGFAGGVYTDSVDGTRNATISAGSIAGKPTITQFSCASAVAFLAMKINGASQAITQTNGCSAETGPTGFSVGYGPAAGGAYLGDILEVIVCDTVLSAADELRVKTYLSTRYGIAVV